MNYKICGDCGESKPATTEFFYAKDKIYLRYLCKVCYKASTEVKRIAKRIKEFGWTKQNYKQMSAKHKSKLISEKNRKYNYPKGITKTEQARLRNIKDLGYNWEDYDEQWRLKHIKVMREMHKGNYDGIPNDRPMNPSEKAKQQYRDLTDGYVINQFNIPGLRVQDVPQEIIQLKRKQLKLYRLCQTQKQQQLKL